jgi:hypothetical protein
VVVGEGAVVAGSVVVVVVDDVDDVDDEDDDVVVGDDELGVVVAVVGGSAIVVVVDSGAAVVVDSGNDESGRDDSGAVDSGTDDSGTVDSGSDDSGSVESGSDSGSDDSGVGSGIVIGGKVGQVGHSGPSGNSGHSGASMSNSVVSTTSDVSTTSVDGGTLVAGPEVSTVSGIVSMVVVDEAAAASNTSISEGICAVVVGGVVAIVSCGSVFPGTAGSDVVVVDTAFGGSTVLSVPCVSPPVASIITTIARATTVAAPATQMIDRDSFHHVPSGSWYPQAISGESAASPADGGGPAGWWGHPPLLLSLTT